MSRLVYRLRNLHVWSRRQSGGELSDVIRLAKGQGPVAWRRLISWPGRMVIVVKYEPRGK